jgi:hypothetical protein
LKAVWVRERHSWCGCRLTAVNRPDRMALWPGPCRPIRQFSHCRCNGTDCKIQSAYGPNALLYTTIAGACLARLKYPGTRAEHEMRSSLPDGPARLRSEGHTQRSNNVFWPDPRKRLFVSGELVVPFVVSLSNHERAPVSNSVFVQPFDRPGRTDGDVSHRL